MNPKLTRRVRWGMERDHSYFSMWAVHPVGDDSEYSLRRFMFLEKQDAEAFIHLLEKSCHEVPSVQTI